MRTPGRRALGALALAAALSVIPAGASHASVSLSVDPATSFGSFVAGTSNDYLTTLGATVTSTGADASLTVLDPSETATGHLVNGSWALASPLEAKATSAQGVGSPFGPIGSAAAPLVLLSWAEPVTDQPVTIQFRQSIAATDTMRTGSYSKSLEFTLSSTAP
jgi:hypothetical protein